jgi:predicted lipase
MIFDEAIRLTSNIGSPVYTHSGEVVVISGWNQKFDNPCITDDLYFSCIDSMFNVKRYRYNELCGPELCDEDKMFIDWLQNKKTLKSDIPLLKEAFMSGFSKGYSHKQKTKSQEQLQK